MNLTKVVKKIGLLHSTSAETPTQFDLTTEIVNHLDIDWTRTDLKFLDPCCGRGTFLIAILQKLLQNGHTEKAAAQMLYGVDINHVQASIAKKALFLATGWVPNIYCEDSLTKEWPMKFDVIVGNPPYQKSDSQAMRWTLWEPFVKKSIEMADTVAMVVPQSLTSPGDSFNLIKDKCTVLNIDVSKHFNVGSTFCYFVVKPNNKINITKIITPDGELEKDISNFPFLPMTVNDETLLQVDYLLTRPKRKWSRGELHTSNKSLFNENGKYNVFHTNAQELKTDIEHKNLSLIRVAVSLSGYPTFRVIQNGYVSQASFWTAFDNISDAEKFAEECNGENIQSILKNFKWSGWNSKDVISCL